MMGRLQILLSCIHIMARDPPPGNIVATDDNESGCLTISFSSGNFESDGWFAEINCFFRRRYFWLYR